MISTFGWTWEYIMAIPITIMNYVLEGSQMYNERQEKSMKSKSGSPSGKTSINSLEGLVNLPGIKSVKSGKKKLK